MPLLSSLSFQDPSPEYLFTNSQNFSVTAISRPFPEYNYKCEELCSRDINSDCTESLLPMSLPSVLQFQDHLQSVTLPAWRGLYWETSIVNVHSVHPMSPPSYLPFQYYLQSLSPQWHHWMAHHFKTSPEYKFPDLKTSASGDLNNVSTVSSPLSNEWVVIKDQLPNIANALNRFILGDLNNICVASFKVSLLFQDYLLTILYCLKELSF